MATTTVPPSSEHITASPKVQKLLQKLHSASEAQEKSISQLLFYLGRLARYYLFNETWSAGADRHMRDKFVSLEPNKCQFLYLLARSIGARNIVEAGTSFGVSTIYLALAVGQNVADSQSNLVAGTGGMMGHGKVIATEKEPTKAARAREHWKEAGSEVEPWIELREGDLLETLRVPNSLPEIDLLLLDSRIYLPSSFMLASDGMKRKQALMCFTSLDAHGVAHSRNCSAQIEARGCYHRG